MPAYIYFIRAVRDVINVVYTVHSLTHLLVHHLMQGLCQSCPKLIVLVINKIISYVSVMANPPLCGRFSIKIIFLKLKCNYFCYR